MISDQSIERIQDKVRGLTKRNRGVSLGKIITDLNRVLRGWVNFYSLAEWASQFLELEAWIRRKLRCYRLKQCKQGKSISKFLKKLGVPASSAGLIAGSGKGWWRLSLSPPVHQAMNNAWFEEDKGLINLIKQRDLVKRSIETAVCDIACTVV